MWDGGGCCRGHLPHLHNQTAGTAPHAASPPPQTPGSCPLEAAWHCAVLSAAASSPALMHSGPEAEQGRAGSSEPAGLILPFLLELPVIGGEGPGLLG